MFRCVLIVQDMKALILIVRAQQQTPTELIQQLAYLNHVCREMMRERAAARHKGQCARSLIPTQ